ncbi:MAG: exonuclease SbcCD subunit D C-terminal domain-containing protein [Lewinellaceae bacterium]|nr:exonuclease SbcCD subunit D C-terminal domain-containing protein [Saprospiraceae bacterium]MCB9340523.1 exonuclease SbcCD subunit D C-terminal domain-containing protein [Lewinellaceae bacterium]
MKLLHTSDWHLGQKFISREREEEHRLALDWLVKTIVNEKIDLLIVAGDVFDIGNPPNYARSLYYNFLKQLWGTTCRHIVVTGGNHDSPHMLNAPKELLQLLNVHVVGHAPEQMEDAVLVLKNKKGTPEAVVAVVPFLRDQDLRRAGNGETGLERTDKIRQGILAHYEAVAEKAEVFKHLKVPIIATGHLCATGAEASEKQDNIYLGNLENIRADQFSNVFDYVALGHIHRAQAVGGMGHVRYSGSLIPLSFSETKDEKSVTVVEFEEGKIKVVYELALPVFRRLKSLEGSLPQVKQRLEKLHEKYRESLSPWAEVIVESDTVIPNLSGLMQDFVENLHVELLRTRLKSSHFSLDAQVVDVELEALDPLEVFQKRCESAGRPPNEMEELVATFKELEAWMREREHR